MIISTLSVAAVEDILIAVFLTFLFLRRRNATGYMGTTHVLQRLTVFAVNTGIWTASFALITLILLHVYPISSLYAVFGLPLCSVYCNTLLANLNARSYIRGEIVTRNYVDSRVPCGSSTDQESWATKLMHMSDYSEHDGGMKCPDTHRATESETA
ncbi:hypothetical protein V8E55_005328 [Tylopilus felleus]